jgi:hypothetical protein
MSRTAIMGVGSPDIVAADMIATSYGAGTGGSGSCARPTHIQTRESKWHRIDTHSGRHFAPVRSGTQVRELRISLAELRTTFAISACEVWRRLHAFEVALGFTPWIGPCDGRKRKSIAAQLALQSQM